MSSRAVIIAVGAKTIARTVSVVAVIAIFLKLGKGQ